MCLLTMVQDSRDLKHIAHTMLAANPGWESKAQDLRTRNCVYLSSDKQVGSAQFVLTQRAK